MLWVNKKAADQLNGRRFGDDFSLKEKSVEIFECDAVIETEFAVFVAAKACQHNGIPVDASGCARNVNSTYTCAAFVAVLATASAVEVVCVTEAHAVTDFMCHDVLVDIGVVVFHASIDLNPLVGPAARGETSRTACAAVCEVAVDYDVSIGTGSEAEAEVLDVERVVVVYGPAQCRAHLAGQGIRASSVANDGHNKFLVGCWRGCHDGSIEYEYGGDLQCYCRTVRLKMFHSKVGCGSILRVFHVEVSL